MVRELPALGGIGLGPFGDLTKAVAELTEFKRAVLILNARLENLVASVDRHTEATRELIEVVKEIRDEGAR